MRWKKEYTRKPDRVTILVSGLLYGLAFFLPGYLAVSHWDAIDRVYSGIAQLPVVTTLSRDFKSGFEVAGEWFSQKSGRFYRQDTLMGRVPTENEIKTPFPKNPETESRIEPWTRAGIESKLEREFGQRKLKRAQQFLDYIENYRKLAAHEMAISQIPASIKLAQALLESGAGTSYLAREANNHFGIKCRKRKDYKRDGKIDDDDFYTHELAYGCEQRTDDNPWDRFERYDSDLLSYRRHTLLLAQSERYNWMRRRYRTGEYYPVPEKWFGMPNVPYYAAWAIGLKEGGYATSKRYAQKLALIIETYELWRIDYEVVGATK